MNIYLCLKMLIYDMIHGHTVDFQNSSINWDFFVRFCEGFNYLKWHKIFFHQKFMVFSQPRKLQALLPVAGKPMLDHWWVTWCQNCLKAGRKIGQDEFQFPSCIKILALQGMGGRSLKFENLDFHLMFLRFGLSWPWIELIQIEGTAPTFFFQHHKFSFTRVYL